MDKKEVLKTAKKRTRKKKEKEKERADKLQKDIISAPDYRETWSDTTKFQLRQVKGNVEKSLLKTKRALEALNKLDHKKPFKRAEVGAVVKVEGKGRALHYFITPPGTATGLEKIKGEEILFLPSDSPLGKSFQNKKEGETFTWQKEKFKILKIN